MTDPAIACTLTPEMIRTRRAGLLPRLIARAEARESFPDGYRLRFAPSSDLLTEIARFVDAERQCCLFLRFVVSAEPDSGPVLLEVTGREGTREFLDALSDS